MTFALNKQIANSGYGMAVPFEGTFGQALHRLRAELKKEGFGVITRIDVQATLRKKIGFQMDQYLILGACDPVSALEALKTEYQIGLLLPCNVIVFEKNGTVWVAGAYPTRLMKITNNPKLAKTARKVEQKLARVIQQMKSKDS